MGAPRVVEGGREAEPMARFGVIASRFNGFVVDPLLQGCLETLRRQGVTDERVTVVRVPGAFEIPVAARHMAASGAYDALIALGAVIRGGTRHFEYVAGGCARGLAQVSSETGVPIAFGVLVADTVQQAAERAGGRAGNRGAEAALVAIEMANLLRALRA